MSSPSVRSQRIVLRVGDPGLPAFRLRKGETGISVFEAEAVDPPLSESEILESFRPGSGVIVRTIGEVEQLGLRVVPIPGEEPLPLRLRNAHAEIRAESEMTRGQFKRALKELE